MTSSEQDDEEGSDAAADQVGDGHLGLHAALALDVADGGGGGAGVRHAQEPQQRRGGGRRPAGLTGKQEGDFLSR